MGEEEEKNKERVAMKYLLSDFLPLTLRNVQPEYFSGTILWVSKIQDFYQTKVSERS